MKTKIKKFLWFDITPRQKLYKELDECYEIINNQVQKIHRLSQELSTKTNAHSLCQNTIDSFVKKIDEYKIIIDNNNKTINDLQNLTKKLANQNTELMKLYSISGKKSYDSDGSYENHNC